MVLKRIGVMSCGKVMGALYGLMGLVIGGLFTLFSLIGAAVGMSTGSEDAWIGAVMGVGAVIFFPLIYGIFGFLGGLLSAFLYNLIAGSIGGLELQLE